VIAVSGGITPFPYFLNLILNLKTLFSQRLFPFAYLYYSIEEKPFQELFENYFNCFYSVIWPVKNYDN
jgi:hypothetical protein